MINHYSFDDPYKLLAPQVSIKRCRLQKNDKTLGLNIIAKFDIFIGYTLEVILCNEQLSEKRWYFFHRFRGCYLPYHLDTHGLKEYNIFAANENKQVETIFFANVICINLLPEIANLIKNIGIIQDFIKYSGYYNY